MSWRGMEQFGGGMALEEVVDAAIDKLIAAGNAQHLVAALARLRPHRAALARAVHDPVRHAAERDHCARLERCGLRQTAETGRDPAAMQLRELARFRKRAARRHGEDRFTVRRMNTARV